MTLTTRRLAQAILFIGLFAMATRVSIDTDTWWHLRAGQWMVEHRTVLRHDAFSHTRAGQPWINHSWLSQIPLFLAWDALRYAGPNLLVALLVVATFAVVYRTCAGGAYLRAFVVVLAAAASGVYWSARPQLASLFLAAVFASALLRFRRGAANRLVWLVPLTALWVNLHGGFALGFILLGLTALGEGIKFVYALTPPPLAALAPPPLSRERKRGGGWGRGEGHAHLITPVDSHSRIDRWLQRQMQAWGIPPGARPALRRTAWLALVGLACAAVIPLNPYGPRMWLYPFQTVSIGVLQDFIQEWQSPDFHLLQAQVFVWLLLATVAAVGFSRRRLDVTDFLLLAAFAYLSLLAGRNIAVFAVVAAPVLAQHAADLVAELQRRYPGLQQSSSATPPRLIRLNWAILGLVALAALLKVSLPLSPAVNEQALAEFLPLKAEAWLREHPLPGRMFNSYNWGGYLIWALYPDAPVFVDGRTDLYDDAFLRDYLDTAFARAGWHERLERYEVDFVLVEHDSILAAALGDADGWAEAYDDATATVFVRRSS